MPAVWPSFQSQLVNYLTSNKASGTSETARKIGTLYHQAVRSAMPLMVPGATPLGGSAQIISKGFEASFKLGTALGGVPSNPAIWAPAGSAISLYWTGMSFSPVPPPSWISGANITTFPGVHHIQQIYSAMKANSAVGVASGLVGAFTTHLASVSGIFTGPNAGSAGAPIPFPWVAIA